MGIFMFVWHQFSEKKPNTKPIEKPIYKQRFSGRRIRKSRKYWPDDDN
jgi:hypothetical protein